MEIQERQVSRDLQECLDRGVHLEKMEKLAQLDHQVHMVQQVTEGNKDLLECTVSRDCQDQQVLQEREENLAIRVSLEKVDL